MKSSFELIRSMEDAIRNDRFAPQDAGHLSNRHYMISSMHYAHTTYLRRINSDLQGIRYMASEFAEELAQAICYPKSLSANAMGEIIVLYGNYFSWETEKKLNTLLNRIPGGDNFRPVEAVNWTENMRLRLDKIPVSSRVVLPRNNIRKHTKGLGLVRSALEDFARSIGAFGYIDDTSSLKASRTIEFFIEDREAAVLATLTYA